MLHKIMAPSPECVALVCHFEGFSAAPYLCHAGVPTIGYGSTHYPDGRPVRLDDPPVSREQAAQIMAADLVAFAEAVEGAAGVALSQHQLDALVSFAYNVGVRAMRGSTLMRHVRAGAPALAAAEFCKWNKGGGRVLPGLVARREAERRLFLGQDWRGMCAGE